MFLVVLAVLSLVLAFPDPVYRWVMAPPYIVAVVAAATMLPVLAAAGVARRALRLLERHVAEPGHGQAWLARGTALVQGLLAVGHGGVFACTGWAPLCGRVPVVGAWPVVPSLLALTPFLLSVVLVWVALYPADRAVRQVALEVYLLRGKPVRPVWSLGEHLVYNLRHQLLFVLVPMLLILAARDVIFLCEAWLHAATGHPYFSDVLLGAAALGVAAIAPAILRYVWATQRLPDGPLRDRLELICRQLGVRCREILIWRAGGMVVNAAVMGVVPRLRYVLITDGLLEQLDDTEIEAVFGHEAGHVQRRHLLFLLLFFLITGCALTLFSVYTRHLDPQGVPFQILAAVGGAALLFKWSVVFGWVSRRFERQADIVGVRTLALAGLPCRMPCALHGRAAAAPPAKAEPLCATAAHVFANTLHEVAALNGIAPDARSWRHGSISARSLELQELAQDPAATARFERAVWRIKVAIFALALTGCVWAGWALRVWELPGWRWFT